MPNRKNAVLVSMPEACYASRTCDTAWLALISVKSKALSIVQCVPVLFALCFLPWPAR
jgi:hypothetical protein